ncbi:MAG: hypothetical protein ACRDLT_16390 [Solirubrobacteraceae bacterium]
MTSGVDLLTWLANHLSQIPEGVGAEDQSSRAIRRAWSEFAPPGVSRVQTDSIRRLYLGTAANGHHSGRTVGIVQWVSRGRRIEQARAVPQLESRPANGKRLSMDSSVAWAQVCTPRIPKPSDGDWRTRKLLFTLSRPMPSATARASHKSERAGRYPYPTDHSQSTDAVVPVNA